MITEDLFFAVLLRPIRMQKYRDHGLADQLGGMRENGGVQGYRDDGVVLRTQKLGEADRIITLLTRHNGRVRAVAKGVRRTKSRFGARLEPFTHVDVMIHPGRSLDTISQAEVIRAYGTPFVSDYPKYTAGTAMLETAERFTPVEKEPAIRQFLLLIGGLRALGEAIDPVGRADPADGNPAVGNPAAGDGADSDDAPGDDGASGGHDSGADGTPSDSGDPDDPDDPDAEEAPLDAPRDPRMVLDAYFLRSLTFAGYAPALAECARCGALGLADAASTSAAASPAPKSSGDDAGRAEGAKPLVAFAIQAGGMVCAGCRLPGSASPAPPTVALMIALLRGDWDKAMRSERRHRVECSGLVAAYLQWHLEHSIRSLRHVERA
jgi:recombinational DNA repair protein (RecF pathway)